MTYSVKMHPQSEDVINAVGNLEPCIFPELRAKLITNAFANWLYAMKSKLDAKLSNMAQRSMVAEQFSKTLRFIYYFSGIDTFHFWTHE